MESGIINFSISSEEDLIWEAQGFWTSTPNYARNTSSVNLSIQVRCIDETERYWVGGGWRIRCALWNEATDSSLVEVYDYEVDAEVKSQWITLYTASFEAKHDSSGYCRIATDLVVERKIVNTYGESYLTDRYAGFELDMDVRKAVLLFAPSLFTDKDKPSISYNNSEGTAIDTLQVCIANETGGSVYVPYRDVDKNGSIYTFNFTQGELDNLYRASKNTNNLPVRFYIKTVVNGQEYRDSMPSTLQIVEANPLLSPVIEVVDTLTKSLTGNEHTIIRGKSEVNYSLISEPQKGAEIVSYSITNGSYGAGAQSGTIENVETEYFYCVIEDSRGNITAQQVRLDIINYINITCNQTVRLVLDSEGGSDDAQVHLTVEGNYFNESFGIRNNTLKIEVRNTQNDGTMGDWVDLTPLLADVRNNTYVLTADISGFDVSGAYKFQCRATDAVGSATTDFYTVKFTPVFDWGKNDFNFNVPVSIQGNELKDFIIETGIEAMGSNGTWYWTKWKSGKAECYGCRNYGNMSVREAWGSLYMSDWFEQDLPEGLFWSTPEYIDIRNQNAEGWISRFENQEATEFHTGTFVVVCPEAKTLSQVYISFHVIGRWKQ